ncbi:MAG: MopE-related protein [bacterium]
MVGRGSCQRSGRLRCAEEAVICDATPGEPATEACNRLDDDCDGQTDEGFVDVPDLCAAGVGACTRSGDWICNDLGEIECVAVAGEPADEACNDADDDCDGQTDEGLGLGDPCTVGLGACARPGAQACGVEGDVVCGGEAGPPDVERCEGTDEDCDGAIDEDFMVGAACEVGRGACARPGLRACDGDGGGRCVGEAGQPAAEQCNDVDDDCDGAIDEDATCAVYAARQCRIWLGTADLGAVPARPDRAWDGCPASERDWEGGVRCASSRGTERYYAVPVVGDVDDNDVLGVAFTCGGGTPALDAWLARHCQVALAHVDGGSLGDLSALDPTTCGPQVVAGFAPNPRCVRTQGDALFHPMWLRGDVDSNDSFAIALRCDDPARPDRAAGLQASVVARLAWQFRARGVVFECSAGAPSLLDDTDDWGDCGREGVDNEGSRRCASSAGDGRFHGFSIGDGHDVEVCSAFGISLAVRAP